MGTGCSVLLLRAMLRRVNDDRERRISAKLAGETRFLLACPALLLTGSAGCGRQSADCAPLACLRQALGRKLQRSTDAMGRRAAMWVDSACLLGGGEPRPGLTAMSSATEPVQARFGVSCHDRVCATRRPRPAAQDDPGRSRRCNYVSWRRSGAACGQLRRIYPSSKSGDPLGCQLRNKSGEPAPEMAALAANDANSVERSETKGEQSADCRPQPALPEGSSAGRTAS